MLKLFLAKDVFVHVKWILISSKWNFTFILAYCQYLLGQPSDGPFWVNYLEFLWKEEAESGSIYVKISRRQQVWFVVCGQYHGRQDSE